jgi:hypothetical protein
LVSEVPGAELGPRIADSNQNQTEQLCKLALRAFTVDGDIWPIRGSSFSGMKDQIMLNFCIGIYQVGNFDGMKLAIQNEWRFVDK